MRVVAGRLRGRKLVAPSGQETRPTSDRVREALFSMLESRLALAGMGVLDLYAGTGALGLEALSRGAARAVFVDQAGLAVRTIEENIRALGVGEQCRVLREPVGAALGALARGGERFELVLADPPYADDPSSLLVELDAHGLLREGGLLALEHSSRVVPPDACGELSVELRRGHGDTTLSLYWRGERSTRVL